MLYMKMGQARKYRDEAGDDGDDSGDSGKQKDTTENKTPSIQEILNTPEAQKFLQDAVNKEVDGLKKKNGELLEKLTKSKELTKKFEGLDVEKLQALSVQMEQNEELRLFAEGKHDEVVNRRLERFKVDMQNQLDARDNIVKERETKLSELENALKQKDLKLTQMLVDGNVREAYIGLDYEPAAMDDVLRLAHEVFKVEDDGKVVPRDAQGNMILGKDGKAISPKDWLVELVEKKPYLQRPSKGGGAGGSGNGRNTITDTSKMKSTDMIAAGLAAGGLGDL